MSKPILVIGHRNPDTDSICSAIAYAHLKQALGENAYPARAGKVNQETKFVLERFGVQPPPLVTDLYPRVSAVMQEVPATISPTATLRELGGLMKDANAKSIAVINGQSLIGIVSVSDLAKRYFDELEMQDLSEAGVDFAGVLRALDGELLYGQDLERTIRGKVRIAAARTATMPKFIQPGDIVLVGDRHTAQLACIEQGIACLIITGDADLTSEVLKAAKTMNTIVIRSPYDTYTSARLVNQSIPVRVVMQPKVISFKPSDLLADIRQVIINTNYRNYPVVDHGKLVGMINRDRLIVPQKERVILVDHNEKSQAVEGIEEAHIIEIIDHHRLGGLETSEPIYIRHEPVGSTSTIVASMHWRRGIEIPPPIAGLLLSAIVSDTFLFRSPTATAQDKEVAEKLAKIAGLSLEAYGMEVLRAGSQMDSLLPIEIVQNDLKEFQIGEFRVSISQFSALDPAAVLKRRNEIQTALEDERRREGYDISVLMVTDIMHEASNLIFAGQPAALIAAAFGQPDANGVVHLPGVMSRKKQVVPPLVEAAREL
ncbi:inorganic diphosphatase [Anaerosporomusa subterranea]|uniref:inorganic diphosphatase n=1 Tax=Anaerosporomusa subterranea TaxID=1794912 RepID=A0A154BMV7_ANASB|nr:putative manganese-dependent inorganic diphosphatase [Anaerosporomusa subterranea]KYZ75180.1 inorganic diphosphatase [Anaerosporomusa subterranea]